MKNGTTYSFAILFTFLIGCSASPSRTPEAVAAGDRVKGLEQAFSPAPSDEERIRIAVELVRLGVKDPKYREFLRDEAEEALLNEERAAKEWKQQMATPDGQAQGSVSATQRVRYKHGSEGQAGTRHPKSAMSNGPIQREPDPTNLLPIVGVSMSTTGDDSGALQLFRALRSDNVLLAAEAALGLARLKENKAIPEIAAAAEKFGDPILFARALTYFGDPAADAAASQLLRDPDLLREMRDTARARNYDPYHRQ